MSEKLKLAIFDLTDCEGCELQLLADKTDLTEIEKNFEIVNFRLLSDKKKLDQFEICLIEGTPLTKQDIKLVQSVREKSKIIIAIGTCAATGGIAGGLDQTKRKLYAKKIYTNSYNLKVNQALPLASYIKVDFVIPGCPVDPKMLYLAITKLLSAQTIQAYNFPVCQECKARGIHCLLLQNKPCLGPITNAGCNATCPYSGFGCLGCLNLWKDGNLDQMILLLKKMGFSKTRIAHLFSYYLKNDERTIYITKELHG